MRTSWPALKTESPSLAAVTTSALQDYNTYVQQFPNSIWAGSKFPVRNEYFKGNPANNQAPTVDFTK